jgi:hypothetical protein
MSRASDSLAAWAITIVIFLAMLAAVVVPLMGLVYWVKSSKCEARWERSGLQSDYGLWQGCMVRRLDGTWVPADNVRDLSL